MTLEPELAESQETAGESPFRLKGNVLVFTGTPVDESVDIRQLIEQMREERERTILYGYDRP